MMRLVVLLAVMTTASCTLPLYPNAQVPCDPAGARCPDGFICVDLTESGAHRCVEVGCGDGVLDPATEECDDGNDNAKDGCAFCRNIQLKADVAQSFGLGVGEQTNLGRPVAIASDLTGTLYVVSGDTNIMTRIDEGEGDSEVSVVRVAGNGTLVDDVKRDRGERPDRVSIAFTQDLIADGFGNVYFVSVQESVIRRIDGLTGLVDTVVGTGIAFSIDDGPDLPGQVVPLDVPRGLTVDREGALYFIDRLPNNRAGRVRRFDPDTGRVSVALSLPARSEADPIETFNDLVTSDDGTIYGVNEHPRPRGNSALRDVFLTVTELLVDDNTGKLTRGARREIFSHSIGINDVRVPTVGELPIIGGAQQHYVTRDGVRFFVAASEFLNEDDRPDGIYASGGTIVAIDFDAQIFDVLAYTPDALAGRSAAIETLPLSVKPNDIALVDDTLFVVDSGIGVVWRVPVTSRRALLTADDVAAGVMRDAPTRDPALEFVDEIAQGFAREADGRVSVMLTNLCCRQGEPDDPDLSGCLVGGALRSSVLEFGLALPELHRVAYVACNGATGVLAGNGVAGASGDGGRADLAQLNAPSSIVRVVLDTEGNDFTFIADSGNNVIRVLRGVQRDADTFELVIEPFVPTIDGVPLTFNRPSGLAVDDTGKLLIADTGNNRVVRVDAVTGEASLLAFADPLVEPTALIFLPIAIIDATPPPPPYPGGGGFFLVVERGAHRVRGALVTEGQTTPIRLATLAGEDGVIGDDDSGDGAATGRLRFPRSIMFGAPDTSGGRFTFFVTDAFDRVRSLEVAFGLGFATTLGTVERGVSGTPRGERSRLDGPRANAALRSPSGIASLDDNRRLVVDRGTGRLRLLSDETALTVLGLPNGALEPGPAQLAAPLRAGAGIAIQSDVEPPVVWLSEADGHSLRRVTLVNVDDPSTWIAEVSALPVPLTRPEGLAVFGDALYVADAGAHVVVRYVVTGGVVQDGAVFAGVPNTRGSFGDGGAANAALLNGPQGVAVRDDVVVIADTGNNRVRRVKDDVITTILGDGTASNAGEGGAATAFSVNAPRSVALDDVGNVYVTAGQALRQIGAFAGQPKREPADGRGAVRTMFGRDNTAFPESVMRCLDDVVVAGDRVFVVDGCASLVVPLSRACSNTAFDPQKGCDP